MSDSDSKENAAATDMGEVSVNRAEEAADWLAKPMFCLSLFFLVLVGGLIVAWVDFLPSQSEEVTSTISESSASSFWQQPALLTGYFLFWILVAIWPVFLVEPLYVRWLARNEGSNSKIRRGIDWLCIICPPLRMGKSIPAKGGEIWLPKFDWHPPGRPLHKALERVFSKPMLIIAMMILPVLLIEFGYQQLLQSNIWLKLVLSISMGLIWCAFACEFILMVSSTNKKLEYVKKNWIDLAIILLPLISFLRSLRATRLIRFAKFQKLTKMGRIYRMRGLLAKTIRAFLILEIVNRVLKISPEKRLDKLLAQVEEKEDELQELRQRVEAVRAEMETQKAVENEISLKEDANQKIFRERTESRKPAG